MMDILDFEKRRNSPELAALIAKFEGVGATSPERFAKMHLNGQDDLLAVMTLLCALSELIKDEALSLSSMEKNDNGRLSRLASHLIRSDVDESELLHLIQYYLVHYTYSVLRLVSGASEPMNNPSNIMFGLGEHNGNHEYVGRMNSAYAYWHEYVESNFDDDFEE